MKIARNAKPALLLQGFMLVWLFVSLATSPARAQRKPASKPAAPASPAREDPLAPLLRQATQAIDKMDFAAALDPLQKYIAERPDDSYAHFQLGYAYAGLKRAEDAKAEFTRAVTLDPKMAAAHLNLGLVLLESDPGAAAEAFRHAAELQPSQSRPRFLEGLSLEHAGKLPEAIDLYRGALALDANDYEIHFALGRALLRTRDAGGAEAQFQSAIALRTDSAPARLGLANALEEQKKYEAASDAFAEYLKRNPADHAAHFDRATALLELKRFDEALAELDLAVAGDSPAPEMLKMRGEIYLRQEKWKEARETLTEALKASSKDPELAFWLGHVDFELHDYPAAIGILSQVYAQHPQFADPLRDLASAFFLNENYAEALGAMDRLDKLETPKPGSWFVRAICYDKLSRKAEAIDAYQKFLDQDNGQHDTQDIQARHRMLALQNELKQSRKK
jgi:tetratricopeptide (TPR) repeat protein